MESGDGIEHHCFTPEISRHSSFLDDKFLQRKGFSLNTSVCASNFKECI